MKSGLHVGHTARLSLRVGPHEIIHLGAGSAGGGAVVFSTPAMINLMEHAARAALGDYLEEGEESVGVRVDVEHLAATPIAAEVQAEAKVTGVEGRMVDFEITARDAAETIGRGTHRRAVVRTDRLVRNVAEKALSLPEGVSFPMNIEANTGELEPLQALGVETEGAVVTVTLNRPNKLNAVDVQMTGDWEKVVAWLGGHEEFRVVIVTGAGRAFCTGDDIKELAGLSTAAANALSLRQARMYLAWEVLPQVFIAAINGHAHGGGCVCAFSCDLRIAAQSATLGMPEILLGWPPGYGNAQLTALVGKARALELCLTGQTISAQQALEWGLVNRVVGASRLMAEVRKLAEVLLATPPIALRQTKRLLHADEPEKSKIAYLADTAAYVRCFATQDAKEGMAAFKEKRRAQFRGR